jgi:mannose/fructose/N-acetylgalactosamine-specific phosphotransferase system component IIC/mannose/fructose/N-acetylgalactosamine-specific phosphotransferase system component IID
VGRLDWLGAAIGLGLIIALLLLSTRESVPTPIRGGPLVSLGTAALIGLCYYLSQSAWLAGLGYWTLYRPLVAGALVGVILGDPQAGVRVGAVLNLAFLGFLGTGGALPTDMALVGYAGTTIALTTGMSSTASLAVSLPLGLLGYGLYRVRLRWSNLPARRAMRYARRGDVRGIARCNVLIPQAMLVLLAWVPALTVAYLAPQAARGVPAMAPEWAIAGLDLTGRLLVAMGVANGLALVWTRRTAACYLVAAGAALTATGREMAVLGGGLGALVAMVLPWITREAPTAGARRVERIGEPVESGAVRPADRRASLLTWMFFSHASYSEERLQGVALAHALAPVLRRVYTTRSELASALVRYLAPFNVEPNLGAAVVGVLARQEARRQNSTPSATEAVRTRLTGPVSGVGDTVIHGAIGTLAVALAVAAAPVVGGRSVIAYCLVMAVVVWGVSGWAFQRGYHGGLAGVLDVLRGAGWRRLVVGAECASAIVLGVLTVGPVAGLLLPVTAGDAVATASLLDQALYGLPAVALVLVLLALRHWGGRQRRITLAAYGIGLAVALWRALWPWW